MWLSAVYLLVFAAAAQGFEPAPTLKILLVEGQGAINFVNRATSRRFTIRVEEKFGAPGKGIPVTFTLPAKGPSGSFKGGGQSLTVTTDDDGYAVVSGFRPNRIAGQYNIRVSADVPGGPVTALIPQTNAVNTENPSVPKKVISRVRAVAAAGTEKITGLVRR
jgi:hypothetical protein